MPGRYRLDRCNIARAYRRIGGKLRYPKVMPAEPQPASPFQCWRAGGLVGPTWDVYVREHLLLVDEHLAPGAWLLACPDTGKEWVHLPECGYLFDASASKPAQQAAQAEEPDGDDGSGYEPGGYL